MKTTNNTILITGGGSGIGRALAPGLVDPFQKRAFDQAELLRGPVDVVAGREHRRLVALSALISIWFGRTGGDWVLRAPLLQRSAMSRRSFIR